MTIMKKILIVFILLATSAFAFTEPPEITVTKPIGGDVYTLCSSGCDFSTMEGADGNIGAGNTLRVKAGTYASNQWHEDGTSGNEIVIEAFGDGRVVFQGNFRTIGDYVIFDGGAGKDLEFKRVSGAEMLIRVVGNYITFWRVRVTGPTGDCDSTDNTGMNWINTSVSAGPIGIKFYNSIVSQCNHKGLYVKDATNSEIRNNVFHSNESHNIQLNPHDPGEIINGLIISGNVFRDSNSGTSCEWPGKGIYILGTSDSDGLEDVDIYNNLFWDLESDGISFNSGAANIPSGSVNIYNNTIYSNGGSGIWVGDDGIEGRLYIANNILNGNSNGTITGSGSGGVGRNSDNNSGPGFQSTDDANDDFLKISGSDNGSYDTNPPVSVDYFGSNRPASALDIGADEYGAVGDTTAPVLASATIEENGTTLTLVFTEAGSDVQQGSGYNDSDFDLDSAQQGDGKAVEYSSGNGTNTHIYTIEQVIYKDETINLDFNGDTNSLEDDAGNDLAAIVSDSVTNLSIQITPVSGMIINN